MMRLLFILVLLVGLSSCSSSPINPTVNDPEYDEKILNKKDFRRLVIAPINLGKPSRIYLTKKEKKVDNKIEHFLKANGYTIVSSRLFEARWDEAIRQHGEVFNPTTGKLTKAFMPALAQTVEALTKNSNIDGVVFTDLIEREVQFSGGINHVAKWDGVSRKPSLQGPGDGVPVDFNWSQSVKAASLYINIFDKNLQRVFSNIGGIEVTQAISLKGAAPKFIRRRKVLNNDSQIFESIKLAFHPLVTMVAYPRKKK